MAPAIARGNTVVMIPSQKHPLSATDLYQVLDTSDVPPGVVNIVTGDRDHLTKTLVQHEDVDALWYFGTAEGSFHVEYDSAANMKRTWVGYGIAARLDRAPSRAKGTSSCTRPRRSRTSGCRRENNPNPGLARDRSRQTGCAAAGDAGKQATLLAGGGEEGIILPISGKSSTSMRLRELAALFLKLGITGFGGPAAHIAMMHDEIVQRRKWLSDQEFLDLLGATNLIPGPNSTEMAIHIGYLRAGWPGLIAAGAVLHRPGDADRDRPGGDLRQVRNHAAGRSGCCTASSRW